MKRLVLLMLGFFGCTAFLTSQQEETLTARVLHRNGNLVQVDRGREAHLEPGNQAWLYPLGSAPVRGVVASVEARTAWIQVTTPGDSPAIAIGTSAEILVTRRRTEAADDDAWLREPGTGLPTTPPVWQTDPFPREAGTPLLAIAPTPETPRLPLQWNGHTYLLLDIIHERESSSRTSSFGRTGLDLHAEDPNGTLGDFRLAFDLDLRSFREDGVTDRDRDLRLERLSYSRGHSRTDPVHWRVGRFLPLEFPEFGVLDGAEVVYRRSDGHRFGSSVGYLPKPGQEYRTGEDLQFAATYQGMAGEERQYRWGLGLQKSWHEGTPDRDLVILKAHFLPSAGFSWTNTAWVDLYRSSDSAKDSGPEISLWTSYLNWNRRDHGSSLGFRHWRLPQTLRFQEDQSLFPELAQARTSRLDASQWIQVLGGLRLTGRADYWRSQEDSGKGGDLQADMDRPFGPGTRSWIGLYYQDGGENTVGGFRLGQSVRLDRSRFSLAWEGARYRPSDGEGTLRQQDLRLSWDYRSSTEWSLSLDLGRRFGGDQDALITGLYLQRSF